MILHSINSNVAQTFVNFPSTIAEVDTADDSRVQNRQSFNELTTKTGIPIEHISVFKQYSQERNLIFGIRPVSPLATSLITAGYPTKDFHIKGKSSDWGPQAGHICRDQSLSKLAGNATAITKYNKEVEECINGDRASSISLVVSRFRLDELRDLGCIEHSMEIDGKLSIYSKAPNGETYEFSAIKQCDGNYKIMHNGRDVEILSHRKTNEPLVPDYDILLLASHISYFGSLDTVAPYKRQDPDVGGVSVRLQMLMDEIHTALGRDEAHKVIQHGADTDNEATDIESNYPAVLFSPKRMGEFDAISVINSTAELCAFIHAAKDEGFQVPVNEQWKGLEGIVRKSYADAKLELAAQFAQGQKKDFLSRHQANFSGVNAEIGIANSRRVALENSQLRMR